MEKNLIWKFVHSLQVDITLNEALKPKIIATNFGQTTLPATKLLQHALSIKRRSHTLLLSVLPCTADTYVL